MLAVHIGLPFVDQKIVLIVMATLVLLAVFRR